MSEEPNSVEDMLRGSGALELGKFPHNIYKADRSYKSFSNRSEYEKIDMFGKCQIIQMKFVFQEDLKTCTTKSLTVRTQFDFQED